MNLDQIHTVDELEDALSDPTPGAVEAMTALDGDVMLLGINGKMGPTLARMVRRASQQAGRKRRVIGVSRFSGSSRAMRQRLEEYGIETVQCDLLDRNQVSALPDAANVIFMAGMKFGSGKDSSSTWAMNAYLPGLVCERYIDSRIAAFSTGNVYGYCPVSSAGSCETDELNPVGEYAMSCLGRERIFEYFSRRHGTRTSIIRLNYAVEYRYGVIVDIAKKLLASQPINLAMGHFNAIWQADANGMAIGSLLLADSPPYVLNVAGPEMLRVRDVATRLGSLLEVIPEFVGNEHDVSLLSCGRKGHERFGLPGRTIDEVIEGVARWMKQGGEVLDKPTKFESVDGKF